MSSQISSQMSIKLLSGDIININTEDLDFNNENNENIKDQIRILIQKKFYSDYPIYCIELIKNESDSQNEEQKIDYFLFIHDRIDLDCVLIKDCIYDSSGKFYQKYNIINKDEVITSVYVRNNFSNYFILSSDIKILYSDDSKEIIRMPTKYKDMKQVLQSCLNEQQLKIINFGCVMG